MKTLLKKAGIVVAATTAALLAVSPLAFAGSVAGDTAAKPTHAKKAEGPEGDCNISQSIGSSTQTNTILSLLNFNDLVDANAAVPICDNNVNVQVIPIASPNSQSIK